MSLVLKLIRLLLLVLPLAAAAQSKLPPCPADVKAYWHNCFGTFTFADSNKYVGELKDGRPNGQGTFTFANGEKYVGELKDGRPNGQGTFTFADGNKYVGEFKDDKYHGQGTETFAGGGKFVGEYKDDKRNGQGIEYRADGTISRSGRWVTVTWPSLLRLIEAASRLTVSHKLLFPLLIPAEPRAIVWPQKPKLPSDGSSNLSRGWQQRNGSVKNRPQK